MSVANTREIQVKMLARFKRASFTFVYLHLYFYDVHNNNETYFDIFDNFCCNIIML